MTDQTITQPAAEGARNPGMTILNVALAVLGISILALNATRLYERLETSLPRCTASSIESTVLRIARGQGVEDPKLSDARQTAEALDERSCTARLTNAAGATTEVTYRVYRNDTGRTEVSARWNRI